MSCTLIFTAGAKGGSGKTTAARFLITYLQEKGCSPLILDLDDENHTLSRFFPEAVQIGIQPEFAHDVLIEKAISQEHGIIVADLKAGTGHEVLKWFLELPFSELKRRGVAFICVGSITSAPDSVQSFLNWAASLDDHVRYLVFRNLKDGDQLFDYDQTRQAGEFRTRFNPAHVTVPKLSPLYQTELEIRRLTISQVLAWSDGASGNGDFIGPVLSPLLARARLRTFQNNIYRQLDQAAELILPESRRPTSMLKGVPMPDHQLDKAAVHYLIAESTRQLDGKAAARLSHPSLSDLELELGAKVQRAVQQGVELGILDDDGRLQTERLVARGLLDPDGNVIKDIFGRSVPCQP